MLLHQKEYIQEQILEETHITNKNCKKRRSQQAMAAHLRGKKVQTHQDDEVRYIFTPTYQSYNSNLKNILFWTNFREEERTQVNKTKLVGLFKVEWKTPRHNILVQFLNNQNLDFEHNIIKVMLGEGQRIINKHMLAEVFKICHT